MPSTYCPYYHRSKCIIRFLKKYILYNCDNSSNSELLMHLSVSLYILCLFITAFLSFVLSVASISFFIPVLLFFINPNLESCGYDEVQQSHNPELIFRINTFVHGGPMLA